MAIGNAGLAAPIEKEAIATQSSKSFLTRDCYLCMSLLLAALVIVGFSRTVNASLFHANLYGHRIVERP